MSTVNQINLGINSTTGNGMFVGNTSATITSPTFSGSYALATPGSGNLSNCTNIILGTYNSSNITLNMAYGTLTANQLKALHATPIAAVAAQGANTIAVVYQIWCYFVYNTTPYTAAAAQTIALRYGTTTSIVATLVNNTNIKGTSNFLNTLVSTAITSTATTNAVNTAINFYNPIATEFTNGDSTINWCVQYYILTTP